MAHHHFSDGRLFHYSYELYSKKQLSFSCFFIYHKVSRKQPYELRGSVLDQLKQLKSNLNPIRYLSSPFTVYDTNY